MVRPACWSFEPLWSLLGLGRVFAWEVETPEAMGAGLLGLSAAPTLLEDWVLHLK